jgi:hypothetical protein
MSVSPPSDFENKLSVTRYITHLLDVGYSLKQDIYGKGPQTPSVVNRCSVSDFGFFSTSRKKINSCVPAICFVRTSHLNPFTFQPLLGVVKQKRLFGSLSTFYESAGMLIANARCLGVFNSLFGSRAKSSHFTSPALIVAVL